MLTRKVKKNQWGKWARRLWGTVDGRFACLLVYGFVFGWIDWRVSKALLLVILTVFGLDVNEIVAFSFSLVVSPLLSNLTVFRRFVNSFSYIFLAVNKSVGCVYYRWERKNKGDY